MGRDLARSGKREEALPFFERAMESNPAFKGAFVAGGRTLSELGRLEEGLKSYEAALKLDPVDREALSGIAEVLMALSRAREALDAIDRALELSPREPDLLIRKGAALFVLGQSADSARSYEDAISINPQDPRAWAGKGQSLLELGHPEQALNYLERAASLDEGNSVYLFWKGKALARLGRHDEAVSSFNGALDHDQDMMGAILARADSLLALGRVDEAVRAYNRALVLAPQNKAVCLGRARCSMRQDRFDEAIGYLDKALAIDANFKEAADLRTLAASMKEKNELEGCARQILDFEQRTDRMPTREEAFRDCQVPFEKLDRTLAHIGAPDEVDLKALSPAERDELNAQASDVIRKIAAGESIRLSDVVKIVPGITVLRAKRVLGNIEAVRGASVVLESPLDPRTEERSRAGLHLPDGERDLFGLVRRLNLPLFEARRVEEVIKALKSGRPLPAPPVVEEPAAAEVPESELETSPDIRLPEKRPRRPRRKPAAEVEPGPEPEEAVAIREIPEKEPAVARPIVEEGKGEAPEKDGEQEEKPEDAGEERPARRPRRRKAATEEEPETGMDAEAASGDQAAEPLDDKRIADISDSIKDIVSSIERRETRRVGPDENADEKGRSRGRTYCSVCHSIIATIHHGCGAHLCSRCVIDFNKDRRAERNLCPKCLKPIETVPPPASNRAGWRDTL
jgi:tetratricopeptide (TPR) repeat protein